MGNKGVEGPIIKMVELFWQNANNLWIVGLINVILVKATTSPQGINMLVS